MTTPRTFYWFGVKKLEVATRPTAPNTTPEWKHVPSIEQATISANVSEVKVYGDDTLQYTFVHSPEMQLNVRLTKFSGEIAQLLTGNTVQQVSGVESLLIMTDKDLNPPRLIARVTIPAKDDSTGAPRDLVLIFFNVQFRPIWDGFGSERGKATELSWVGDILASTQDERGNPLPSSVRFAMGRYDFPTA